ncbi:hypothetical protein Plim_1173 [Planctopirus limnophila DSM 3776]|uniref:Uncharacterized protein n=1 Tax=Planctopirus limnophila (strain ATCC 43296 / DSM 3776 / IFAM 1008 / Mu 290) TaxID=521674 RepID=D5SU23_PLAL2|nr:hypothetical protein [Planctopirus limnophila]ADG67008.1 hypothetical protein Plim_1173 [Planctopirus limnophila DSM 3776]
MEQVVKFLDSLCEKLFTVHFVLSVHVENSDINVTHIKSFLTTASSRDMAFERARASVESLNDSYRNREGCVVVVNCEGVHDVEEVPLMEVDGYLDVANFQFSGMTSVEDLVSDGIRKDLPVLN